MAETSMVRRWLASAAKRNMQQEVEQAERPAPRVRAGDIDLSKYLGPHLSQSVNDLSQLSPDMNLRGEFGPAWSVIDAPLMMGGAGALLSPAKSFRKMLQELPQAKRMLGSAAAGLPLSHGDDQPEPTDYKRGGLAHLAEGGCSCAEEPGEVAPVKPTSGLLPGVFGKSPGQTVPNPDIFSPYSNNPPLGHIGPNPGKFPPGQTVPNPDIFSPYSNNPPLGHIGPNPGKFPPYPTNPAVLPHDPPLGMVPFPTVGDPSLPPYTPGPTAPTTPDEPYVPPFDHSMVEQEQRGGRIRARFKRGGLAHLQHFDAGGSPDSSGYGGSQGDVSDDNNTAFGGAAGDPSVDSSSSTTTMTPDEQRLSDLHDEVFGKDGKFGSADPGLGQSYFDLESVLGLGAGRDVFGIGPQVQHAVEKAVVAGTPFGMLTNSGPMGGLAKAAGAITGLPIELGYNFLNGARGADLFPGFGVGDVKAEPANRSESGLGAFPSLPKLIKRGGPIKKAAGGYVPLSITVR